MKRLSRLDSTLRELLWASLRLDLGLILLSGVMGFTILTQAALLTYVVVAILISVEEYYTGG